MIYDAGSSGEVTPGSSPLTISHTCSSNPNRVLFVGISADSDIISSVTYAGQAMSQLGKKIGTEANDTGTTYYIYGILNPTSGANDIVISWSGSHYVRSANGSYTGARQNSLPDAFIGKTKGDVAHTSLAETITTTVAGCWVGCFSVGSGGSPSSITNGTIRTTGSLCVWGDSNSAVTPAGNLTMTSNFASSVASSILLVSFAPSDIGGIITFEI